MQGYRISLECGDTSSLRTKKTLDGFTHDWEVWIKGVDNAPIQHYIERVVFNLHETFPKPKRVIKEPPYCLKESGYAGFDIIINVHLKNKNEPKRFDILYNLNLDTTTPTISHRSLHNEIIVNPAEEFRKKLLKGGAIVTSVDSPLEKSEMKTLAMVGKPKLSSNSEVKKHRIVEPKTSNQFNDLFGPPIKTAKLSQESKKTLEKSNSSKAPAVPEKSDKVDKSTKVKHSPHKDSKKEKSSEERKEKKDREKDGVKDKDKSKEKSKRSSSPSSSKVSHQASDKRPSSPSIKKTSSPAPVVKRLSSPISKPKEKESKKDSEKEKDKDREKEKSKDSSKSATDDVKTEKSEKESKSERKKEKKKHKEDREKEKKDKHRDKEREKSKDKEGIKSSEKKVEKPEKAEKEKPEVKPIKEEKKSPKSLKENDKIKEEKIVKTEKVEKNEKEKSKDSKSEKSDKSKHKHKKKDKKEKRDGSREREKKEKREKSKSSSEPKSSEVANPTPIPAPVTTRVPEIVDRDSSDSSGDEDSIMETRLSSGSAPKKELPPPAPPAEVHRTMSPPPAPVGDKKDKVDRKHDKSKSRREEKESKKRKRKSESKGPGDEEISSVKKGKDRDHSTSPLVEPVSSSQSPIATNADILHSKVKHTEDPVVIEPTTGDSEQVAPDSTNSTLVDTEEPLVFSEDYVLQLKELQQKIMTLQDNQELQRVVQVIAETGQYEITKKTFDFDLCTLDRRTVQRLQQFFAS